jgi:hypothetical protein
MGVAMRPGPDTDEGTAMAGEFEGKVPATPRNLDADLQAISSRSDIAETVELIEAMTIVTIGILRQARCIHAEGESEYIARTDILDVVDPHWESLSAPIKQALEVHVRRVVAEFFESRRQPWES